MTSKEDQRAIGDTDLLEEEKKKEEEEDYLVVGDDDDDDKQVKASDEGGNNTSSNGKRSAYPHDGDKQGADGTAKKCEMNSSPGDSGATMIEKNDHLAELDNDLTFEVASFVPRGLTLGNICVALGLEKAKLLRKTYQKYHLAVLDNNEALLVEVASFLPRGLTLRNICVALGLEKAKLLRRNYLKKNYRFLEEVVQDYETATWRTWGKQKATVDLRAWMAANTDKDANTDWKDVYRYWSSLLPGNAIATRDAYAFLTIFNPKMAIDLGLLKVLKFFVEEVDISASANSLLRLLGPYVDPTWKSGSGDSMVLLPVVCFSVPSTETISKLSSFCFLGLISTLFVMNYWCASFANNVVKTTTTEVSSLIRRSILKQSSRTPSFPQMPSSPWRAE